MQYAADAGAPGRRELRLASRAVQRPGQSVNLYYTVRELSNHVAEMWPLRSLGAEIFQMRETFIYSVEKTMFGQAGGGYPWLQEHLLSGYVPAWRQPLWNEETDAAIGTQGLSRWHNYYVEGMRWLMERLGLDGLYLDGIGYDREIMKRIARVMRRASPTPRINFHSGDNYVFMDWRTSPANSYMEHFPFISNLWLGEMYDYDMTPDQWLVEISGIPFGLTSEMLNYENGGNAYRGMVYGMSGRQHPSAPAMWRLWDRFGMATAEWLGYWSPRCPVKTDRDDVKATVYRKPGRALVALAHWASKGGRRTARAAALRRAPSITGRIEEGEWAGAAQLAGFSRHGTTDAARDATRAWVTWDSHRLYVAFRCATRGVAPRAECRTRDGELWTDDAVEIFVQPDPSVGGYFQFIGNSAGVFFDARGTDGRWNADWRYAASVGRESWEGELSVAWSELGVAPPKPGAVIGMNICRDQQTPEAGATCWSPVNGAFHNPSAFGLVTLAADGPSSVDTDAGPAERGAVALTRLRIDWKALGIDPARAHITAPAIDAFQQAATFRPGDPIPVPRARGWLLEIDERGAPGR